MAAASRADALTQVRPPFGIGCWPCMSLIGLSHDAHDHPTIHPTRSTPAARAVPGSSPGTPTADTGAMAT